MGDDDSTTLLNHVHLGTEGCASMGDACRNTRYSMMDAKVFQWSRRTNDYGTSGSITDQASQIASLIDSDGSATHLADESYLGLGTVVQQDSTEADLQYTLIKASGTDPVTGDIYSGLDLFGRIKELRWQTISTTADLSHVDYGYNRASSRTWRANRSTTGDCDWLYNYDGLQRVAGGTRGTLNSTETAITDPTFGQCWTLDSTGNWQGFRQDDTGSGTWNLEQARTASTVNEITAINNTTGPSWATPVYDPAGNMTTVPRPELTTLDPQFGATYDAWNRLVKLTDDGTGLTTQQNQYDGRNYRTVVQTYDDTGALTEIRHAYYTDNWQCVEERLGTSPDSANPDRQFVWGVRYIDDLVCRNHSDTGVLDVRLYGCQDANWNMTAVVGTSGAVQERYEYDPYGNCTFLSPTFTVRISSSYEWETLYAGYRFDTGSNLYSVRNRFYHPRVGTWLTRDPLGMVAGSNVYLYASPVAATDPYGLLEPGTWSAWWFGTPNSLNAPAGQTPSSTPLFPNPYPNLSAPFAGSVKSGSALDEALSGTIGSGPNFSLSGDVETRFTDTGQTVNDRGPLAGAIVVAGATGIMLAEGLLGPRATSGGCSGCRQGMRGCPPGSGSFGSRGSRGLPAQKYGVSNKYPFGSAPVKEGDLGTTYLGPAQIDSAGKISFPKANYGVRDSLSPQMIEDVTTHELQHINDIQTFPGLANYAANTNPWAAPGSGYLNLAAELRANTAAYNGDTMQILSRTLGDIDPVRVGMDALYTGAAGAAGAAGVYYECNR